MVWKIKLKSKVSNNFDLENKKVLENFYEVFNDSIKYFFDSNNENYSLLNLSKKFKDIFKNIDNNHIDNNLFETLNEIKKEFDELDYRKKDIEMKNIFNVIKIISNFFQNNIEMTNSLKLSENEIKNISYINNVPKYNNITSIKTNSKWYINEIEIDIDWNQNLATIYWLEWNPDLYYIETAFIGGERFRTSDYWKDIFIYNETWDEVLWLNWPRCLDVLNNEISNFEEEDDEDIEKNEECKI